MKRLALLALLCVSHLAIADDAKFEGCKAKLKKAKELDLLYGLEWNLPSPPKVTVGKTFFSIPLDAKEGFAETLNCFLTAGQDGSCVQFEMLHWQTGKPVAAYHNCRFKMY
jgi:hypothetical protein